MVFFTVAMSFFKLAVEKCWEILIKKGWVAALARSHMNSSLPFKSTVEQTIGTIPLTPKTRAHFQKEWKPGAKEGARSIMGSFEGGGGAHAFVFKLVHPPKQSHKWARAHYRPSFPLFLKVGYSNCQPRGPAELQAYENCFTTRKMLINFLRIVLYWTSLISRGYRTMLLFDYF